MAFLGEESGVPQLQVFNQTMCCAFSNVIAC